MAEEGLVRSADFKIWLMAEIPSNIIMADQFNKFVDGYSIGSNDLTMLILGLDRDNEIIQDVADGRDLAVKRAIRHLIEVAHRDGKTVSICGQLPEHLSEFCEFLIKSGIDYHLGQSGCGRPHQADRRADRAQDGGRQAYGRGKEEAEDLTW